VILCNKEIFIEKRLESKIFGTMAGLMIDILNEAEIGE